MGARRSWSGRVAFGLAASLLLQVGSLVGSVQAATSCKSSTPTGAYEVIVCLADPEASATIAGEYLIRASAEVDVVDIRVRRLVFYLDGTYLLIDLEAPYEFVLPTPAWPDGTHTLGIEAIMQDDAVTARLDVPIIVANGRATSSPRPEPFTPRTPAQEGGRPFVVAAVGDGASGERNSADVTDAIVEWDPDASAERLDRGQVAVSWSASDDDTVVTGYQLLRDGQVVAETSSFELMYVDTDAGDEPHEYGVVARDIAGGSSRPASASVAAEVQEVTPLPAPSNSVATAGEPDPTDETPPDSSPSIGLIAGTIGLVVVGTAGLMLTARRLRR